MTTIYMGYLITEETHEGRPVWVAFWMTGIEPKGTTLWNQELDYFCQYDSLQAAKDGIELFETLQNA